MKLTEKQEKRQNRDMQIIIGNILKYADPEPYLILLCGGYGRDEGAWLLDREGNPVPYNDYDITVVSKKSFDNKAYEKLRKKIAGEVGIRWIDIDWHTLSHMKRLSATIKNYDMLNASRVIYGDEKMLRSFRQVDAGRIGEKDTVTLYQTRIWTFLGSWEGNFRTLGGEDAVFFRNQMAKAVLAACDMLLVSEKAYTSSYKKRVDLVKQQYKSYDKLIRLSEWALNEKLHPSSGGLSKKEMEKLYWDSRDVFCLAMKKAMGGRWYFFENPDKTKWYFCLYTRYVLSNIYNRVIRRSGRAEKYLDIFLVQNYVFCANRRGTINKSFLKKASDILQKWGYTGRECTDWDQLRKLAAYARNNV